MNALQGHIKDEFLGGGTKMEDSEATPKRAFHDSLVNALQGRFEKDCWEGGGGFRGNF